VQAFSIPSAVGFEEWFSDENPLALPEHASEKIKRNTMDGQGPLGKDGKGVRKIVDLLDESCAPVIGESNPSPNSMGRL